MQMTKLIQGLAAVALIAAAVAVNAGLLSFKKAPEKKHSKPKAMLVETQLATKQSFNHRVVSQGTVRPKRASVLVSQVNGRVIAVSDVFVAGGFFSQGEVLIRIDPADYKTAVKSAQANVAKAQAALEEEKARGEVALSQWQSLNGGEAPALYLRKPQLATALANVLAAKAGLEGAQRDLARTSIRAPFNGMIAKKDTEIGRFVTSGANLAAIYGTDIAEIRLPLADSDMAFIQLPYGDKGAGPDGLKVTLQAKVAGKVQQWQARIVRSEGVVDDKTRVIYVVAQFDDPYGLKNAANVVGLSYGRFVQATIEGRYAKDIVIVPRHVLTYDNEVLLVKDQQIEVRPVEVLRMDERNVLVTKGIDEGDSYIISVVPNPINGMAVRTAADEAIVKADKKS